MGSWTLTVNTIMAKCLLGMEVCFSVYESVAVSCSCSELQPQCFTECCSVYHTWVRVDVDGRLLRSCGRLP